MTSDWHLDSDGRLVGWFATSAVEVTLRLALLVSAALVGVAALALPSSDSPSSRATESEQGGSAAS